MKVNKLKYQVIEVDPPKDFDFDLESWIADLLISYHRSIIAKQNKEKTNGGKGV